MGVDGERQEYEEKLRIMREELNAKYNEQMDGMKKREASSTLRVNTKLACVARQRDELETKLHLVEKKYDNIKKQMSTMEPSVNSTFQTKNIRGVNDTMSKIESVTELGSAKSEKYPDEKMVGSEKILQSFEKRMKDIYGVVNDMRAEMTEMKNMFLAISENFEKFPESYGGGVMKTAVVTNETEPQQDEHQCFEIKSADSEVAKEGSSTALRQDGRTDKRLVSRIIPKESRKKLFSINCSAKNDGRLNDQVEISKARPTYDNVKHTAKDENSKQSNKNDQFAESFTNESLTQNEITYSNKSEQGKTNSDICTRKIDAEQIEYKVVPTDLRENYDSSQKGTNPLFRNGSRNEDSGSEWDLEDDHSFDGTDMDRDIGNNKPPSSQQNYDLSSDSTEDEAGLFQPKPRTREALELHECKIVRTSLAAGGNEQRKKASSVCCFTCKLEEAASKSEPRNWSPSHTDNPRNYQTQNGCVGKCCRCSEETTSTQSIQKCSCFISKNSSRGLIEGCPRHQKKWCRNSSCDIIELSDCCKSVGRSEVVSRDHVQRHVVKSSAIIANLRDLKADEVWM